LRNGWGFVGWGLRDGWGFIGGFIHPSIHPSNLLFFYLTIDIPPLSCLMFSVGIFR